jgi:hypothetical protein
MSSILLYRVSWDCPDHGMRQEWCTTEAKAMRFARRNHLPADSLMITIVGIPKTKVKLCEWLNIHFSTDNG